MKSIVKRGIQKSVRLLKIWKLCKHEHMMTAATLAQRCGVTERTIYRDLRELGEMGVAIDCHSGYRVISEDLLPQLNLTHAEKVVLTMALRYLPLQQDKELKRIAESLLNKLLDQPVENTSVLIESRAPSTLRGNVFARLQKAIEEHRKITLARYRKLDNEILLARELEPYLLVFKKYHWYLVAWTGENEKFQTYRLDRIEKLHVENTKFPPREFDPHQYFRGSLGAYVDHPQRLRARFTGIAKEIVRKSGRVALEDLHDEGESLLLDTIIRGEIQWLRWILGFGGEAEILEPESMREKAKTMLQAAMQAYHKTL